MSDGSRKQSPDPTFDLEIFFPFVLNQTAEATGRAFQNSYRSRFNLSRTQWRVLAIVGRYEKLTSRRVCDIANEEKSRVSRAVSALENRGLLSRTLSTTDRRAEELSLTDQGKTVYEAIGKSALDFDKDLRNALGDEGEALLRDLLARLQTAVGSIKVE